MGNLKKVFDRENITLYNGDCMDFLRECNDETYELAIVDPPYGNAGSDFVRGKSRFGGRFDKYRTHETNGSRAKYGIKPKNVITWDNAPPEEYFKELFRVTKRQIIWGGNYFNLPARRGFLIWDKLFSDKVSFASCEYAWVSWPINAKIFRGAPVLKKHNRHGELFERFHPTQKPAALYRWILELFSSENDKILDTHAGSCSLLVACHQIGRTAVGIEIDKEYCHKSVERLNIEMEQQILIRNTNRVENLELTF